jgi:hypothetical protein
MMCLCNTSHYTIFRDLIIFKRIVSQYFGVLFMNSLDSYEVPTIGPDKVFFILMPFSYLNFKKIGLVRPHRTF